MAETILKVSHASFGDLTFTDDELVEHDLVYIDLKQVERSQLGNKTAIYLGDSYEFRGRFSLFLRSTGDKLDQIFRLRDTFQCYALEYEAVGTVFNMQWFEDELPESYVRGRLRALNQLAVVWEEITTGVCAVPS